MPSRQPTPEEDAAIREFFQTNRHPTPQQIDAFFGRLQSGQTTLEQRALDQSQRQYDERAPFRNAAFTALGNANSAQPWDFGAYNPEDAYSRFQPLTNNYRESPDVQAAYTRATAGPDRIQLTRQMLADLDKQAEPELQARFRRVGQAAATLGRLGSGGVTTELGDIQSDYERNRIAAENESVRNATEADVGDRYRALGAAQGLDQQRYGRSQNATELAVNQQGVKNQLGADSLQARIQRWRDQQNARQAQVGNALGLAGFGYGGDPTATYLAVADRRQQQANMDRQQEQQGWGDFAGLAGSLLAGPVGGAAGRYIGSALSPSRRGSPYGDYTYDPYSGRGNA